MGRSATLAENIQVGGPPQVVFVLHGIRANNRTWVQETLDLIKARWPDVEAIGPGYGYVSALSFAIPSVRRRHIAWFQDAYSEALAHNPSARFSFIGHSNGTYLLGESLKAIPGMRFERVALAGSVLPSEYDWAERIRRGQVQALRVDGSRYDWPVAWLCSALHAIRMKDVGTWYAGGHSAPLDTGNLPGLAEYAVTGTLVRPPNLGNQSGWFRAISRSLRIVAPVAALVAIAGFVALFAVKPLLALAAVAAAVVVIFILDIL